MRLERIAMTPWSVRGWIAADAYGGLVGDLGAPGIDSWPVGRQAAAAGPGAQPLDRFAGRHGNRNDVLGRIEQRHIQQGSQPATGLDLGAREIPIAGTSLAGVQLVPFQ